MFVDSEQLKKRIQTVSEEIELRSGGKVVFEEYISLPHYGYIILRFNLNEKHYAVSDLDRYEAMMYECAGDEFLIDFMGGVYRNVGIDYRQMEKLFADCLDLCKDEKLFKSTYADMIGNDAKQLLALCGIPADRSVWEIQLEDEIQLLLLGNSNKFLGRYEKDGTIINTYQVASKPCEGLAAAVFYAKRNNISLANVLLKVQGSEGYKA